MATPFVYPNGSNIDVFLERQHGLFDAYSLSDYGQTALYLQDAQTKLTATERRRQILGDICDELGVRFRQGSLLVEISSEEIEDISDAIMRLAQACSRVSDFASHQRLRSANPFRDDVEEFFDASGLQCEPDVKLPGPYGRKIKIDLQVASGKPTLVLLLAAMNEPAAHASANEIFRKWSDLKASYADRQYRFVTVYNSASRAVREDDIQALSNTSLVFSYPQQQESLLRAVGE